MNQHTTTAITTPPALSAREDPRKQVHQLIAQGLSNRAIAATPGMPSRETVRRWRTEHAATAAAQAVVPPAVPQPARHMPPGTPTGTPDVPDTPPGTPTGTLTGTPTLTLHTDGDLGEDLAILAEAGHTPQDAIGLAVQLLADAYRSAWDYGHYDRGTRPDVRTRTIGGHPSPTSTPTSRTGTGS